MAYMEHFMSKRICFSLAVVWVLSGLQAEQEVISATTQLTFKVFDSLQVHGPTSLHWVKADTLHVSGPLTFSRLSVGEDAVVEGSMQGDHGKFGSLEVSGEAKFKEVICGKLIVRGSCEAEDLMVNGDAKFFGPLQVNHGELEKVMALGEEVILDNVTADTIHLERHEESQILILRGSTLIRGDIQLAHPDSKVQTEGAQVKILGQTHIKK